MPKDGFKRVQVSGERYQLPEEEVRAGKLIERGLRLQAKAKEIGEELEDVKAELTAIAENRRGDSTTVSLKAISGDAATVTFRESYEPDARVHEIAGNLGSLFDRFFERKESWKAQTALKTFMDGKEDYGLPDPAAVRETIAQHVRKKTIKPNVKLKPTG